MKNKTLLTLLEQLVMLLVFSLASALCVRAFALAEQTSQWNAERDDAVFSAQNAAEVLKAAGQHGGTMEAALAEAAEQLDGEVCQGFLYIYYDKAWNIVRKEASSYRLCAQGVPSEVQGLLTAEIRVDRLKGIRSGETGGKPLFKLTVAWQEVESHG